MLTIIHPVYGDGLEGKHGILMPYAVQPAFTPLPFGAVKPRGWILEQMRRDLRTGFAGHLGELCHEVSSDIFATARNQPRKMNTTNVPHSEGWWNGETEGNWRCGYLMLACLSGEPTAVKQAKDYVDHILASQDADGYIGIFSPEMRYQGRGELWTQTCLFRGMLAYGQATSDARIFPAIKRAVDRTIAGYAACEHIKFTLHDQMYTDVLEQLYSQTGDRKYLDFGLRLYHECPGLKSFLESPEITLAGGRTVFNVRSGFTSHGATVTEAMRMPLWFWLATGESQYRRSGTWDISAMDRYCMPSGALVSEESVNRPPIPWGVGYEYCAISEREFTLLNAAQKVGDANYADEAEHLWLNAAQGSRVPDGSGILYCSSENRLSVQDEFGKRQRFSPTHQNIAVCCNPNAARIAPYYTANSWMRPTGSEPAIAAMLYGPVELTTDIAGSTVSIQEKTHFPFSGDVELDVHPAQEVGFCLWLRDPSWSRDTKINCPGADIHLVNGYWQVRKKWNAGDKLTMHFDQAIRAVRAINGEAALQYGPLLYVLPVPGVEQTVRTYAESELKDYLVAAAKDTDTNLRLSDDKDKQTFGFVPKTITGTDLDFPLDNPPIVLEGTLMNSHDAAVPVTLVPMGAQNTQLRRVTFRIDSESIITGGFEAENAKLLGNSRIYTDPAASGSAAVGWITNISDGIECQSPLLTGRFLKILYAAGTDATLTLQVNGISHEITFPATGAWNGEGAYAVVTVSVAIPENAVVKLWRGPNDGTVNLDCLKGEK